MRSRRFASGVAAALALAAAPLACAAPCAGFLDVQDTDPFCTHVAWMKNRAITLGCTSTLYCPADYVRRDQMAAFLYRLGVQNAFLHGGNAFGAMATLGTTDNHGVAVRVRDRVALRILPSETALGEFSPNVVAGQAANEVGVVCSGICVPAPDPVIGAVVGGGGIGSHSAFKNRVTDSLSVVGGGMGNAAGNDNALNDDAQFATVAGGAINTASATASTVGGGQGNIAQGRGAVVAGGDSNRASGHYATVPGGISNDAGGFSSVAAGYRAKALHDGCFVFGDATPADLACGGENRFVVRATGGVYFHSQAAPVVGVRLLPGSSSWSMISDRALKRNVEPVDAQAVLDRLAALPISTWSYASQPLHVRHIGPMAQDFRAAFDVGEDDTLISTVDAQGVALAAIQGLAQRDRARAREIETLRSRNAALEAALQDLVADVRALKRAAASTLHRQP